VFVAGVVGAVLAADGIRQWPVALLVLCLAVAWDALFLVIDTVPATVPVAAALMIAEARRPRTARRPAPCNSRPAKETVWQ
jgi:hypothetical protein